MSTSTKVTCDHCGAENAAICFLVSDGDPRHAVAIVGDLHACRACVAAIADFFPKIDRGIFAKLSEYEDEIPVRSAKRALPVPKDAYREVQTAPGEAKTYLKRSDFAIDVVLRPQTDFKMRHLDIERPSDWVISDIQIGNRSQFAQAGDVPGECFTDRSNSPLEFDGCVVGMTFTIRATYVGSNPEGAHFVAKLVGTSRGFPPKKS